MSDDLIKSLLQAQAEIARLREALAWVEKRKPLDIKEDGTIGRNAEEHGRAAYDMWACARAALSPQAPPDAPSG